MMLFWFSVIYSKSPCIAPLLDKINRLFFKQYNIVNLLDNDVDAIISRINFVETHEPRSHYVYVPDADISIDDPP